MFKDYKGSSKDPLTNFGNFINGTHGRFHVLEENVECYNFYLQNLIEWSRNPSERIGTKFDADVTMLLFSNNDVFMSSSTGEPKVRHIGSRDFFHSAQRERGYALLYYLSSNPDRINFDGSSQYPELAFTLRDVQNHFVKGVFSMHFGSRFLNSIETKGRDGFYVKAQCLLGAHKVASLALNDLILKMGGSTYNVQIVITPNSGSSNKGVAFIEFKLNNGNVATIPCDSWLTGSRVVEKSPGSLRHIVIAKNSERNGGLQPY